MTSDERMFFNTTPGALPLYEVLRNKLLTECPDTTLQVQKSQITFKVKYGYAFVSLAADEGLPGGVPNRDLRPFPPAGLAPHRRGRGAVPQPADHHTIVSEPDQLDGELMGWLREAHAFALVKEGVR